MKKYIAPVVRNINIEMESIIALSNPNESGDGWDASNRFNRRGASSVIWGFDDEAVVEGEY